MAGLGSRLIHSGMPLLDKYLGDALYAVMFYLLLALIRLTTPPLRRAGLAMLIMTTLELFQLTAIPLALTQSGHLLLRICGRLLGTTFSWLDLAAYLAGIAVVLLVEGCWCKQARSAAGSSRPASAV